MQIGMLGDIIFEVSSDTVRTVSNASWSGSANYSTHSRHTANALTEFVGLGPDSFSFDIVLSYYLGTTIMEWINLLWKYEREGIAVPLTLGEKGYGKYRWNVVSHTVKLEQYDKYGNLTHCTVSVELQEYLLS